MKNNIVVIGSSNVDLIMKMDHLPQKGETVTDAIFMQVYGGKGANQAVAAARAGGNVTFVSCLGEDAYTPQMVRNYETENIDTRFLFHEKNIASGHALIMIGGEGENIISVAPGANALLLPAKIEEAKEVFEDAALIVMQFEIPAETIEYVLDRAGELQIPVMWNVAPVKHFNLDSLQKVSILVLNEIEAAFLSGLAVKNVFDAESAAKKILEKGVRKVIITLGEEGVISLDENGLVQVPAFRVTAKDTTAAGDTFCGALAVSLVEGKNLKDALLFANAAAALSVTRMGAQPSIPNRTETEIFIKNNL